MTLQDLLGLIDSHPVPVAAYFLGLPLLAYLTGRLHPRGALYASPLRWVYSAVLFGVGVPGLLALVALLDQLFAGRLLEAGIFSEILPVISLFLTLGLIVHSADPAHIPGFRRVRAFLLLLAVTAVGGYLLMQTRIWVFFGAGLWPLLGTLIVLFLFAKWAFDRAFGSDR